MLKSRLPKITHEMLPAVEVALRLGAETVAADAESRVAVGPETVHIRDHIHVNYLGPLKYEVAAGDDDTFYGHMLENGTSHSAPRPFLIPAIEAKSHEVVADVRAAIKRAAS